MLKSRPMINIPIPLRYSLLVGNLVIRNAVRGITTPIASEYPLVTH